MHEWVIDPMSLTPSYLFFVNVYSFLIQRDKSASWGGAEREGGTESEAGARPWAVRTEPDAGLELTDREIMTWAEVGRSSDWATQVPPQFFFNWSVVYIRRYRSFRTYNTIIQQLYTVQNAYYWSVT